MHKILPDPIAVETVATALVREFAAVFSRTMVPTLVEREAS